MKISSLYTKEIQLLESLMEGTDVETRRYLRNMHENFVVPYNNYLNNFFRRLDEAELTPEQITQLFGSVAQQTQAAGGNETLLGKMLPDAIKKKFADSLPPPDAGEVPGFDQRAAAAAAQVQDPAAKQSIGQLIKTGIQNPATQKLILAAVQGVAGAVAGALTAGMGGKIGSTAAGALTGGLISIVTAKLQGQDWKTAGKAGLKGAAVGAAGGLLGNLAGGLAGSAMSTPTPQPPTDNSGVSISPDDLDPATRQSYNPTWSTQEYKVQPGDNLSTIAQRHGVSVYDLMQDNPEIKNPDVIKAGQTIQITTPSAGPTNPPYAGGVGTASDTMAKIQSGEYAPSDISTQAYQRATAPATPAGPSTTPVAADEFTPPAGTTTSGSSLANIKPGLAAPLGADGLPMKEVPMDTASGAATSYTNHPGTPDEWRKGNNPPPDWIKNYQTGEYAPPATTTPDTGAPVPRVRPEDQARLNAITQEKADLGYLDHPGVPSEWRKGNNPPPDWIKDNRTGQYSPPPKSESIKRRSSKTIQEYVDKDMTIFIWAINESVGKSRGGVQLTEAGVGDMIKSVGSWLKTKGQNLTQTITADKLMQAYKKEGSPTDSDKIAQFLEKQGVAKEIIANVYQSMGIPLTPAGEAEPRLDLDATEPAATTPAVTTPAATAEPAVTTPAATTPAATAEPAAPAQAGGSSIFDDPNKLLTSFDAFIEAGGKIPPAFRGELKEILLTALRTVESRQRKINKIVKEAKQIKAQVELIKQQKSAI